MSEYLRKDLLGWVSELTISLVLVVSVGVSLTTFHQSNGIGPELAGLPQMRGEETRQIIRSGVPEVWLEQLETTLYDLDVEMVISRYEDIWLIDIFLNQPVDKKIQIVLERYGIKLDESDELKVALTSV